MPDQTQAPTIGDLLSQKADVDRQISELNAQLKTLKSQETALDQQIMDMLDEQGTTSARGQAGTASIRESIVPNVVDWDAFYQYIAANNYFHLLERRPSAPGCRELFGRDGAIPGVEPFNKRTLGFTKS